MSKFLTKLDVELVDPNGGESGDGTWCLTKPLIYRSDVAGETFIVPVGFVTDFNSTPRVPVAYLLAGGTLSMPAALHDWLYTEQPVTRAMADAVLREAGIATGAPAWRAWIVYCGVRIGGGSHWKPKVAESRTSCECKNS